MQAPAAKQSPTPQRTTRPANSEVSAHSTGHQNHAILKLQRALGNQAVLRLLQKTARSAAAGPGAPLMVPLQAKLEVGSVDDPLEREADRLAGEVMGTPASGSPSRCACGAKAGAGGECDACKARRVARRAITPAAP